MKKAISILLIVSLFLCLCVDVDASVPGSVEPCFDYIAQARASIAMNEPGVVTVSCVAYGHQNTTTRIAIEARLQQLKNGTWTTIETYYSESETYRIRINETVSVSKNYMYRVQATITAHSGTQTETQTILSSTLTY